MITQKGSDISLNISTTEGGFFATNGASGWVLAVGTGCGCETATVETSSSVVSILISSLMGFGIYSRSFLNQLVLLPRSSR